MTRRRLLGICGGGLRGCNRFHLESSREKSSNVDEILNGQPLSNYRLILAGDERRGHQIHHLLDFIGKSCQLLRLACRSQTAKKKQFNAYFASIDLLCLVIDLTTLDAISSASLSSPNEMR